MKTLIYKNIDILLTQKDNTFGWKVTLPNRTLPNGKQGRQEQIGSYRVIKQFKEEDVDVYLDMQLNNAKEAIDNFLINESRTKSTLETPKKTGDSSTE